MSSRDIKPVISKPIKPYMVEAMNGRAFTKSGMLEWTVYWDIQVPVAVFILP